MESNDSPEIPDRGRHQISPASLPGCSENAPYKNVSLVLNYLRLTDPHVLEMKTHTKITWTYQYLYQTSCHQDAVFHKFIKGTVISTLPTNSDSENLKADLDNHKYTLLKRVFKT